MAYWLSWAPSKIKFKGITAVKPRSSYSLDDDDDESDPSCEDGGSKDMTFTLHRLESLHGLSTDDEKRSSYTKNGMCRKRIRHVAKNPGCPCACSVPVAVLLRICCAFWSLGKCAQDALLWTLQTEGGRRRINYMIEGVPEYKKSLWLLWFPTILKMIKLYLGLMMLTTRFPYMGSAKKWRTLCVSRSVATFPGNWEAALAPNQT